MTVPTQVMFGEDVLQGCINSTLADFRTALRMLTARQLRELVSMLTLAIHQHPPTNKRKLKNRRSAAIIAMRNKRGI